MYKSLPSPGAIVIWWMGNKEFVTAVVTFPLPILLPSVLSNRFAVDQNAKHFLV